MHRNGEIVLFNDNERASFGVPPELTALKAVDTALELQKSALIIDERAVARTDSTSQDMVREVARRRQRAADIHSFAVRILDQCPDEHLALILNPPVQQT